METPPLPHWRGPRPAPGAAAGLGWTLGEPAFRADGFDRERRSSPWAGHRWFAYDLLLALRPRRVVELGTHFGCSFFAMCEAALDGPLDAELVAIDTWEGDPHAGFYGDEVYDAFTVWLGTHYSGVKAKAVRAMFDDARATVDDGSVDVLHIDGYHTYEAVSHDFQTWRDALTPDATVLFHDVAHDSGYESSRFWDEMCAEHGGFTFFHNFGLGVLSFDARLRSLLASDEFATIARYYPAQACADLGAMRAEDLTHLVDERQALIATQDGLIADCDRALAAQTALIDEQQALIASQDELIADRDEAIGAQARLVDERQALIEQQDLLIAGRDEAVAAQARRIDELMGSDTAAR